MNRFATLALTAGGLGFLRPASGTWGSLPPAIVAGLMVWLGAGTWAVNGVLVLFLIGGSLACLAFGNSAETVFGKKDPGEVVADEVAGQALTLLALPWPGDGRSIAMLALIGFLSFRVMDIIKPPPARGLQRLSGGLGILIDDLLAAIYAAIVTQIAARWLF
ncbi:MAG: phosphatidylglycerophosphatase A [Phycisphaerae bacterium]|nr:phosphatidylglycerophosphatase A [Phycisphaerae bacterium]